MVSTKDLVRGISRRSFIAAAALVGCVSAYPNVLTQSTNSYKWYKGNLHTHTNASDGEWPVAKVANWYKQAGYNFLFITDHNMSTPVDHLNRRGENFRVFHGNELTTRTQGEPTHVNALGYRRLQNLVRHCSTIEEMLQDHVYEAINNHSVPMICHPNYRWAFGAEEMMAVSDVKLFELYNAATRGRFIGDDILHTSTETMWDEMLSRGKIIFGTATDDAHHYSENASGDYYPGRAWVMVRAKSLSEYAILNSLQKGDFYSSTGVELLDVDVSAGHLNINIFQPNDTEHVTEFIGYGGRQLQEGSGIEQSYHIRGDERYIRAKIARSDGAFAWIQPVFVGD